MGIPILVTGKTVSWHWDGPLVLCKTMVYATPLSMGVLGAVSTSKSMLSSIRSSITKKGLTAAVSLKYKSIPGKMIFILTQAPDNSRKTHHVTECEHCQIMLTHWGRVTNICVGNLTIIGSDNGLSPYRRQAIIWTNAGILLIGPLRTFSEILIYIQTFSFKKMHLKMSSAKWRPFCLGLNVLNGGGAEPLHQTKYKMPRSHTHQFARQVSKWPHHSEIWQPSRQHFCQGSCQISEWYNHDKLVLYPAGYT